jgi:hypothetical protein
MRVLLDECVNPRVKNAFAKHEVRTVIEMGWGGITNGRLMALVQQRFDVFVTVDQNLEYQQNHQAHIRPRGGRRARQQH